MNIAKGLVRLAIVILSIIPMILTVYYCVFVCFRQEYIMLGILGVLAVWIVYWVISAYIRFVVRGFLGKPWKVFRVIRQ